MTEPREALQPDERELARLNHSGTHSCRGLCPGRFLVALEAAEARLAAGVHLGDEGHPDAGNHARNHYDWFMPDDPTGHVDGYLDDLETKLTEALTDPFVHDMAQAVLPLVAAYRSVHLGDEGLREAAQEVLAATGDRPPEGPEPTTAEVERWYIANDSRIIRALAALALAAQENPAPARSAPSLDEGLLALALYEVDGFGLLSECRETARDIASVYRRLAQEGETP